MLITVCRAGSFEPSGSQSMDIEQRNRNSVVVLRFVGDLDMKSTSKIRTNIDRLIAEDKTRVAVNLETTTGADSSGLGTLVASLTLLKRAGGKLALCCMQQDVRNVMEITNVMSFFPVYNTEEEACNALAASTSAVG